MSDSHAIAAQAELHHQYFIGLQLMVAVEESRGTVYDWMFRLFRRQHEEKFLSSFDKLACAGCLMPLLAPNIMRYPIGWAALLLNTWKSPLAKPGCAFATLGGCMPAQQFAAFRWRPVVVFCTAGMRKTVSVLIIPASDLFVSLRI